MIFFYNFFSQFLFLGKRIGKNFVEPHIVL